MQRYFVEGALMPEEREAKLPTWVREKLQTLRRAAAESIKELYALKQGTTPSEFWLERSDETNYKFYLPTKRLIFESGSTKLELVGTRSGTEKGDLTIYGLTDGLVVLPSSSNVIIVRSSRFKP